MNRTKYHLTVLFGDSSSIAQSVSLSCGLVVKWVTPVRVLFSVAQSSDKQNLIYKFVYQNLTVTKETFVPCG